MNIFVEVGRIAKSFLGGIHGEKTFSKNYAALDPARFSSIGLGSHQPAPNLKELMHKTAPCAILGIDWFH